jgi:hypothetical protein
MATLTVAEFGEAVAALADHMGVERLRERLASMNAFTSRRGLTTAAAIAERLNRLSGGLRLSVPATYAFSVLWSEMLQARMGNDAEKALEDAAERVNACLDGDRAVLAGREGDLDAALGTYRETLAAAVGADVARLDMLLKAVPVVADRLRAAPAAGG